MHAVPAPPAARPASAAAAAGISSWVATRLRGEVVTASRESGRGKDTARERANISPPRRRTHTRRSSNICGALLRLFASRTCVVRGTEIAHKGDDLLILTSRDVLAIVGK